MNMPYLWDHIDLDVAIINDFQPLEKLYLAIENIFRSESFYIQNIVKEKNTFMRDLWTIMTSYLL